MGQSFWTVLVEQLCHRSAHIMLVFTFSVVLLLFSVVSFFVVEPGTATRAIVIVNLITLVVLAVVSGAILHWCVSGPEQ